MRIAIYGVGAVGGYFGGRLTQTDHEIIFIARGAHLAAIQSGGLRINSDAGNFVAEPALATDNPAEAGEVDAIILATKAWQVAAAAAAMQPMMGAETVVVPLLNGVEAPQILAKYLGETHVFGGFCRVLSKITAPGHVEQGGTPPFVAMGELDGTQSERLKTLAQVFESAGIEVRLPESIQAAMWQKLLFIASFGGVGAVTRMTAGIVRSLPETRTMLEAAMQEVVAVANARGIPMQPDAVAQGMQLVDTLPEAATASMQRDLMSGRSSELNAQNGAVVRLGAEVNIPTPTHRFLYHALLPMEKQARGAL